MQSAGVATWADACCPVNYPYYCDGDKKCYANPFFSCSGQGKAFCSSSYNNCS